MKRKAFSILSAALLAGAIESPAFAQTGTTPAVQPPDGDTSRAELSSFNNFANRKWWLDDQLQKNPSLINDPTYLSQHLRLATYLKNHPNVAAEFKENPAAFEARETKYQDNRGISGGELRNLDNQYLKGHPDAAAALQSNPKLIDNPQFRSGHPELQTYLTQHPDVRQEIEAHPSRFASRERGFEGKGGIEGDEVRKLDRGYLDQRPEVTQALAKNPKLLDDPSFLAQHPELGQWEKTHPEAAKELRSHPYAFEARERAYEKHESGEGHGHWRHQHGQPSAQPSPQG
jgi:hypothetical protein